MAASNGRKKAIEHDLEAEVVDQVVGQTVGINGSVEPTEAGIALYDPDLNELAALLEFANKQAEDTELEGMIVNHNAEQLNNEREMLVQIHEKLSIAKKNKQVIEAQKVKAKATARFNALVKKSVNDLKSGS